MGHLITRTDPCVGGSVTTYQNKGFLAWDPKGKLNPPGEANIGDLNGQPGLVPTLSDLVTGTGQIGCGYEAQLEAWYRFLVDPNPYDHIELDDKGRANPVGTDNVLLQQRVDFMRPDSLLAIIMLTDENDCSTKEYGQFYYMAQTRQPGNPKAPFFLPNSRSECDTNPNDKCCKSCGQSDPSCPADRSAWRCRRSTRRRTPRTSVASTTSAASASTSSTRSIATRRPSRASRSRTARASSSRTRCSPI
jgi:hypothetical protein